MDRLITDLFVSVRLGAAVIGLVSAPMALANTATVGSAQVSAAEQISMQGTPRDMVAQALERHLSGKDDAALRAGYAARAFAPYWSRDGAEVRVLIAQLRGADRHGLPVREDLARALEAGLASLGTDPDQDAMFERDAARAYLVLAKMLGSGLLRPSSVDPEIALRPKLVPKAQLLERLFAAGASQALDAVVPQDLGYAALLAEKERLTALLKTGGWGPKLTGKTTLRPDMRDDAVVRMRARLVAMGYLEQDEGVDAALFDEALVAAVSRFQAEHGLVQDGVVGPATRAALNIGIDDRLQQVIANLERRRWTNYPRGARHIIVNLADFSMQVVDNDETVFRSGVVVGRARKDYRTPEFSHKMTYLVVNPYWHVPASIAEKEYLPQLKRDPDALARQGLVVTSRAGTPLNLYGADFTPFAEDNFPFLIKQPPGGRNALGRVKFMFPNKYNIYLHDTPAKGLFSRDVRAYSHGCVRVAKPFDLARLLMAPKYKDPNAQFRALLNSGKERTVYLKEPVPIYLLYHSVFVDEAGKLRYRPDIYKRDRKIMAALRRQGVPMVPSEG